ncbi:MFS transporter [Neisseriaceae bacterium ESL0693]|nr:MFS transporter [Neisseriaceae bacterium ESL0693]
MPVSFSLSRSLIFLMALATGLAVASNYYVHPLIVVTAQSFHINVADSGFLITLTQLAYALGLVFLVPLGDVLNNKKLIVGLYGVVGVAALLVAVAPNLSLFITGLLLVGICCTVAQILLPLAASMAAADRRGQVIGALTTGLLLGILLSRTFSGLMAEWLGWRMVYVSGALMLLLMAVALHYSLPATPKLTHTRGYLATLRSVWALLWQTPLLRQRGILGALDFSLFSVLWTTLTLLLSHAPYHYGLAQIGLFGLFGALGVLGANLGGRMADQGRARLMTHISCVCFLLSWLLLYLGATHLWALIAGIVLLDFAIQALHITNQSLIYRSDPALKGRIASGYMSMYFIGGVLGSLASAVAYQHFAWPGVVMLGMLISMALLVCSIVFKCERM